MRTERDIRLSLIAYSAELYHNEIIDAERLAKDVLYLTSPDGVELALLLLARGDQEDARRREHGAV